MLLESLSSTAIALGTVVATKALQKVGDRAGESISNTVSDKVEKFLASLRRVSPDTVVDIEQIPEKPLNYAEILLQIDSVMSDDLDEAIDDLLVIRRDELPPDTSKILQEIARELYVREPVVENFSKMAQELKVEKGAMVAQKIEIKKQENNYY